MASEKNAAAEYLAEKKAGGFMEGVRSGFGSSKSIGRSVGKGLVQGGMAAAGAMGVSALGVGAQQLFNAATKARDFRSMLEANPDLAEHHAENPRLFNQMFSTLRTFNPEFSKDPVVAGSYMRQMTQDPMHAGGMVEQSLGMRDKIKQPVFENTMRAGVSGFNSGIGASEDKKSGSGKKNTQGLSPHEEE